LDPEFPSPHCFHCPDLINPCFSLTLSFRALRLHPLPLIFVFIAWRDSLAQSCFTEKHFIFLFMLVSHEAVFMKQSYEAVFIRRRLMKTHSLMKQSFLN
jgi:hypothetical protein